MDKEDVGDKRAGAHTHNGTLFSHEKEENPDILQSVDGPRGCYTKGNKPSLGLREIGRGCYTDKLSAVR